MLTVFVTTGFVLCGIVEQSATVALLANNPSPISAAEFADYVENTSYITRYCQPPDTFNITDKNDSNRHVHVVLSLPHIEARHVSFTEIIIPCNFGFPFRHSRLVETVTRPLEIFITFLILLAALK